MDKQQNVQHGKGHKTLFYITTIATLALCILCVGLPAVQWYQIANSELLSPVAFIAAIAVGICKLTLFPLAVENQKQQHWLPAVSLFFAASLSFWLSVNATRDLLANLENAHSQTTTVNSDVYQQIKQDLNGINAEIATLNALIDKDMEGGYRKRAYQQRPALEKLRTQKQQLLTQLNSLSKTAQQDTRWTFGKPITVITPWLELRLESSTVTAYTLHLICIFSLLAVTAWWPEMTTKTPEVNEVEKAKPTTKRDSDKKQTAQSKPVLSKTPNTNIVPSEQLSEAQQQLAEEITKGRYGIKPILRELINNKVIPGGFKKIRPVFTYLVETQVLTETDNGFVLKTKNINC